MLEVSARTGDDFKESDNVHINLNDVKYIISEVQGRLWIEKHNIGMSDSKNLEINPISTAQITIK